MACRTVSRRRGLPLAAPEAEETEETTAGAEREEAAREGGWAEAMVEAGLGEGQE